MKYSLSARQPKSLLAQADEIIVDTKDYRIVSDLMVEYPDKMIILDIDESRFTEIENIVIEYAKCTENFCCRIHQIKYSTWCKANNVKFYLSYPITTYGDLEALIEMGVEYIAIAAPLSFEMDIISKKRAKFRMIPNAVNAHSIPFGDGVQGQWVRPEDVKHYEEGIYIFDFFHTSLKHEATLFNIYQSGKWDMDLKLLFTGFSNDIKGFQMPKDIGEFRSNCGQVCMKNKGCHYCETALLYGEAMLRYHKKMKKVNEEFRKEEE